MDKRVGYAMETYSEAILSTHGSPTSTTSFLTYLSDHSRSDAQIRLPGPSQSGDLSDARTHMICILAYNTEYKQNHCTWKSPFLYQVVHGKPLIYIGGCMRYGQGAIFYYESADWYMYSYNHNTIIFFMFAHCIPSQLGWERKPFVHCEIGVLSIPTIFFSNP